MISKRALGLGLVDPASRTRASREIGSLVVLVAALVALFLVLETHYRGSLGSPTREENPLLEPSPAAVPAGGKLGFRLAGPFSPAEESRFRALAESLARRYRVSQEVTFDLIGIAHQVGRHLELDPLLILAVIAVESGFNPIAESVAGAKGLMQVIPKYHTEKLLEFGGERAIFDPAANIVIGAQILKDMIRRTGSVGIALQMYAGALGEGDDQYTSKVLNEKQRLQRVLAQARGPGAAGPTGSSAKPRPE